MVKILSEVPPVKDPSWIPLAKKVLPFLSRAKSWADLKKWARSHRMTQETLRNLIAWCDGFGLAQTFGSEMTWIATPEWQVTLEIIPLREELT